MVVAPMHYVQFVFVCHQRSVTEADSKGRGAVGAPPIGSYVYQKAGFFRIKGIYFVVHI